MYDIIFIMYDMNHSVYRQFFKFFVNTTPNIEHGFKGASIPFLIWLSKNGPNRARLRTERRYKKFKF